MSDIQSQLDKIRKQICFVSRSSGNSFTIIDNYDDLPLASTANQKVFLVLNSTGSRFIPTWLGGSFKPKGYYYSDGIVWIYIGEFPFQSTQTEVDLEVATDTFVSPATLGGWWIHKDVPISKITGLQSELDSKIDGAVTAFDIDKIELELKLNPDSLNRYKTYTYTSGNLTQIDIYTNNTGDIHLYEIVFNYVSGNLSSQIVTRMSDTFTYTKTYSYDGGGNLTSINYTSV